MDDKRKYDPEDIESLMMHKAFEELYPEEKTFILEHLDSSEEYESMRKTLLTVIDASNDHDRIVPDPAIKDALLAEFGSQKRGGFTIWLNSVLAWLAPPKIEWYRKPAYQLVMATAVLLIGVFVFLPDQNGPMLADASKPILEEPEQVDNEVLETASEVVDQNGNSVVTEDRSDESFESENYELSTTLGDNAEGAESASYTLTATDEATIEISGYTEPAVGSIADNEVEEEVRLDFDDGFAHIVERNLAEEDELDAANKAEAESAIEAQFGLAENVIVMDTTSDFATRAASPAMVDDIAMDLPDIRDDQIGNTFHHELDKVEIAAVEVAASASEVKEVSDADFSGEALFDKKDNLPPVQAQTKKYKDLIDLLYTAL